MTSGDYFKSLRIIHLALVVGIVFFTILSIFVQMNGLESLDNDSRLILLFVVPFISLAGIITSILLFKKRIANITSQLDLKAKMDLYRSALIIRLALIEMPAFLTVVAYMLTGDYIFIGVVVVLIIVFLLYTPTRTKFTKELELKISEIEAINNPQSRIQ